MRLGPPTQFLALSDANLYFYSDAKDNYYVYEWRQEQERTLRATKGIGMTEEQVNNFVDGCMSTPPPIYFSSATALYKNGGSILIS